MGEGVKEREEREEIRRKGIEGIFWQNSQDFGSVFLKREFHAAPKAPSAAPKKTPPRLPHRSRPRPDPNRSQTSQRRPPAAPLASQLQPRIHRIAPDQTREPHPDLMISGKTENGPCWEAGFDSNQNTLTRAGVTDSVVETRARPHSTDALLLIIKIGKIASSRASDRAVGAATVF